MNPGPLIRGLLRIELERADCSRRRVAAVIAKDGIIVGKGHNSLPEGSCQAGDCPRGQLSYAEQPADVDYAKTGCVSTHAEVAALREAGERAVGAMVYITEWPCPDCEQALKDAGVLGFAKVVDVAPPPPAQASQRMESWSCGCGHRSWAEHRRAVVGEFGFYPPDNDHFQIQGSLPR